MAVTIKDIAQYTGFSITTVSVALNGKGVKSRITAETIKKIEDAQLALNYRPNMLASSLRKGYTNTIGFVVSDLSNPFFIKLASIVEREAAKYGYSIFLAGSDENDEKCKAAIQNFVNFHVDGLIIAATSGSKNVITQLIKQKIPFVLLDRYFKKLNVNSVVLDNYGSAHIAVQSLISKGRRRIATFQYETDLLHMQDRLSGYKDALKENGIRFDKRLTPVIPFLNYDSKVIESQIKELIEEQKIDGIFFQTNRSALPGLKALLLNKYEIPEQVSVICFHDHESLELINPIITSLEQPINEMAIKSIKILIDAINGKKQIEKVVLPAIGIKERLSI